MSHAPHETARTPDLFHSKVKDAHTSVALPGLGHSDLMIIIMRNRAHFVSHYLPLVQRQLSVEKIVGDWMRKLAWSNCKDALNARTGMFFADHRPTYLN